MYDAPIRPEMMRIYLSLFSAWTSATEVTVTADENGRV